MESVHLIIGVSPEKSSGGTISMQSQAHKGVDQPARTSRAMMAVKVTEEHRRFASAHTRGETWAIRVLRERPPAQSLRELWGHDDRQVRVLKS